MMPPYDLNYIYNNVVELKMLYLFAEDHFQIYWLGLDKKIINIEIDVGGTSHGEYVI